MGLPPCLVEREPGVGHARPRTQLGWRFVSAVLLIMCGATACGDEAATYGDPLDVEAVGVAADEFAAIGRATIAAWDSRDLEAIRRLYTDDITHDDDRFNAHLEGIDQVMRMAESMFTFQVPDVRFGESDEFPLGFIGGDGGIMAWEAWNVFGYTEEEPLVELDRLATRDGLTATWLLLYRKPDPHEVTAAHEAAWASGEPARVGALYDPSAVRVDTIFRLRSEGKEAITSAAASFFAAHPDIEWERRMSFGAGDTQGAIFAIRGGNGCSVLTAVLTWIDDGMIVREEVYYEGTSLLGCGWLG